MATPDDDYEDLERTVTRKEARQALAESLAGSARTDSLVVENQRTIALLAQRRQENHFAQKLRESITGRRTA